MEQEICDKSSVVDVIAEADRFSPYVDYSALAENSVALQAFRVRAIFWRSSDACL